jgi:hypothetical protein
MPLLYNHHLCRSCDGYLLVASSDKVVEANATICSQIMIRAISSLTAVRKRYVESADSMSIIHLLELAKAKDMLFPVRNYR